MLLGNSICRQLCLVARRQFFKSDDSRVDTVCLLRMSFPLGQRLLPRRSVNSLVLSANSFGMRSPDARRVCTCVYFVLSANWFGMKSQDARRVCRDVYLVLCILSDRPSRPSSVSLTVRRVSLPEEPCPSLMRISGIENA